MKVKVLKLQLAPLHTYWIKYEETPMINQIIKLISASILLVMLTGLPSNAESPGSENILATQSVIRDQISAFQSKEFDRAFSHAAPSIRDFFQTTDRFIQMVKSGYAPLFNPDSFSFGRSILLNGQMHQEVFAADQKGKQWQAIYTLKQQSSDGSWKITGVKLEPWKGTST